MNYIVNIAVALAVGGLSSLLTNSGMKTFSENFVMPQLNPPSVVFPIVWSVLYVLMAVGYTRAAAKKCEKGEVYYWLQLGFNFFWSIWFFNVNAFFFSFLWLAALLLLTVLMTLNFYRCDRPAALLQLPYIAWLTFAGYLNLSIYFLNRI